MDRRRTPGRAKEHAEGCAFDLDCLVPSAGLCSRSQNLNKADFLLRWQAAVSIQKHARRLELKTIDAFVAMCVHVCIRIRDDTHA